MRPTALVTGASSGIGEEFARLAARDGYDLVLVARRAQRLERLAAALRSGSGATTLVVAMDLSLPDSASALLARLGARAGSIDLLINCAGFGHYGTVAGLDEERQRRMVQLNVLTLTSLTCLLLPQMIARGRGGVLNLGSTASFQPVPRMGVYGATKAYVLSFTEGLHEELRGTGVRACCLCPGPTATGFAEEAQMQDSRFLRLGAADARAVAIAGWAAVHAGRAVVVTGLANRLMVFSTRLGPRWLVRRIAGWVMARP